MFNIDGASPLAKLAKKLERHLENDWEYYYLVELQGELLSFFCCMQATVQDRINDAYSQAKFPHGIELDRDAPGYNAVEANWEPKNLWKYAALQQRAESNHRRQAKIFQREREAELAGRTS